MRSSLWHLDLSDKPQFPKSQLVAVIESIQCLRNAFQLHAVSERELSAHSSVESERIETDAGVATNHGSG